MDESGQGHLPPARRRLTRSHDRRVGGVCGGIAEYFDIDPTIARIVFVVLLFLPPVGFGIVIAYIAAWMIMPEPAGEAPPRVARQTGDGSGVDGATIFGLILLAAGLLLFAGAMGRSFSFPWFGFNIFAFFWPLALVGLGAIVLMNARREH